MTILAGNPLNEVFAKPQHFDFITAIQEVIT